MFNTMFNFIREARLQSLENKKNLDAFKNLGNY